MIKIVNKVKRAFHKCWIQERQNLKMCLPLVIIALLVAIFINDVRGNNIVSYLNEANSYGSELTINEDWIIDSRTIEIKPEQPVYIKQNYHEQYKIVIKNNAVLKIENSYIRSDFRFLIVLCDKSKLIVENSKLGGPDELGAVVITLDESIIEAKDSQIDSVGLSYGNGPFSFITVNLVNCKVNSLQLDIFHVNGIVIEGFAPGNVTEKTISSEKFQLSVKNSYINDIISWTGNADVTFRNCEIDQISADEGSILRVEKCSIKEIVPRVTSYSGIISNLLKGHVDYFQLNIPAENGPSIVIIDSTIEKGWYFRYFNGCNIEFRNCFFSVLRPMGSNYALVVNSVVNELWVWWTSGEIHFENSPIGWIGKIMGPNDILLSGNITVEDPNWRNRGWTNNWEGTVIKREFIFSTVFGNGLCTIKNEKGAIIESFLVATNPIKKILSFDEECRQFNIYLDDVLVQILELSSNSNVTLKFPVHSINASSGPGGIISPSGTIAVNYGDSKTFTITPNQGYKIKDLLVDGTSVGTVSTYTFTNVTSDHTIQASFEQLTFKITSSSGTNGTISPSGTVSVNYGDSKTFTISPFSGYRISTVKVDGKSIGAVSSYTFTNITQDHTIEAIFEKENKETVIILQIGNTTFTVNGSTRTLDSPPIIKNGRTLLPIRAVVEALGGTAGWDATERKVTVTLSSTTIELWIGKSIAKVNGIDTPIDATNSKVVPEIINSRTMLPLRFVAESLDCTVEWDGTTKTITITYSQ